MIKNMIEKEVSEYGRIYLNVNFNDTSNYLSFKDETEFRTFIYLLSMMAESNASSISLNLLGAEEEETTVESEAKEANEGE